MHVQKNLVYLNGLGLAALPEEVTRLEYVHRACIFMAVSVMSRYMMGVHTRNWQWLTFFSVQVPLMALEAVGMKLMKRYRFRIPQWLPVVMTMTVLLWLADAFFFPPCLETGLADRVLHAIKGNISQLVSCVLRSR